jgi:very-short-patch-repair endonuclease
MLMDLAATLPAHGLGRMIERAEKQDLFDLKAVDLLLARTPKHHGAKPLRRALALYKEPPFTRSELERRFLDLAAEAELPTPRTNIYVEGYELDMYWPQERFAVELDGYEHHRTRAAFERDRVRQEALKLLGIEMIRITAHRIADEPQVVVENVAALLRRRRTSARPKAVRPGRHR